jgi:glycosyltransferase involved in cell wall biosynthesis
MSPTDPQPPAARPTGRPSNIEVVIPTFNEEMNLRHALASVVGWADRVHVVDSESKDKTRDIAESFGANVVIQPWLGYAKQKNWALNNLPLRADWIFILDADESITPELRDEILRVAAQPVHSVIHAGFYVNRLTYFLGRPIRHCGYYPSYNLRLFKRGKARYEEREVHEHMIVEGTSGRLTQQMLHEDRRGLEHLIAKHNRYSTLEARELTRERGQERQESTGPLERGIAMRRWLKRHVLPRLPLSGFWRFFYMYILRLGILDGVTGLRFCFLLATYDIFISLKLAEIKAYALDRDIKKLAQDPAKGLAVPEGSLFTGPVGQTKVAVPAPQSPGSASVTAAEIAAEAASLQVVEEGRPLPEVRRSDADWMAAALRPTQMPDGKWPAARSVPVSILIPVKNEERNIIGCLRRVQWATDIVVVDSKSKDKTIELSQAMGADVYQFTYSKEGWPKKKNWALENVPWKNEWVMILDADEYMTPELAEEIRKVVTGEWSPEGNAKLGCGDGFWVNRRFMFMGRWLKGCGYYPSWNVRLFKHKVGRYERIGKLGDTGSGDNEVHEHVLLSTGEAGYLRHEFLHYAYPDLSAWIEKHNRYTTWEAHAMEAKDEGAVKASLFGGPIERRRWLKRFGRKLPFRPSLRFLYSFFFQWGFLDGYPGFVMCRLLAWYEFMSIAKFRERKTLTEQGAHEEKSPENR